VKSLRATLFSSYLLLILVSIPLLGGRFRFLHRQCPEAQAIGALHDLSAKVVDALDAELFKMNAVSVNIGSSELVRELVKSTRAVRRRARGQDAAVPGHRPLVGVMQTIIGATSRCPRSTSST